MCTETINCCSEFGSERGMQDFGDGDMYMYGDDHDSNVSIPGTVMITMSS